MAGLERATALTSLNGYGGFAAVRAGGVAEVLVGGLELGVALAPLLPRSAATLTTLNVRCAHDPKGCQKPH